MESSLPLDAQIPGSTEPMCMWMPHPKWSQQQKTSAKQGQHVGAQQISRFLHFIRCVFKTRQSRNSVNLFRDQQSSAIVDKRLFYCLLLA